MLLLIGGGLPNMVIYPKIARKSVKIEKKIEIVLIVDNVVGVLCSGSRAISKTYLFLMKK